MSAPRMLVLALVAVFGLGTAALIRAQSAAPASDTEVRSERWDALGLEPHEILLDNGFRIVLVEDDRVPRVAASLWYRVGALQEGIGEHGITHFLEHTIHQGTTTIGVEDPELDRRLLEEIHRTERELIAERNAHRNRVRERRIFYDEEELFTTPRFDSLQQRLYALEEEQSENRIFWQEYNWYREHGGIMRHSDPVPANTGNELMRIEVDLPRNDVELFFRLEADRMANAVLRGFEAQRYIVLEQFLNFNRNETGRFNEALNGASGVLHPTYLHPGGHMRDHWYWDRPSTIRIYEDYMVPNNTTLVLVGDMTVDEAVALGETYFGRIPRGPEPPAGMDYAAEPPPGGTVRLDWHEPLDPFVTVRYRIPGVGHPARPVFDLVAGLLAGPEGLLAEVAAASGAPAASWGAGASSNGSPNRLSMQARAARDEDLPALERVAHAAVERLVSGDFDPARLERLKREFRLDWEATRSHRGDLASELGGFSVTDEWRTARSFVEGREEATAADVQRAAHRYLVPWNRIIGTSRSNPTPRAEGHLDDTRSEDGR